MYTRRVVGCICQRKKILSVWRNARINNTMGMTRRRRRRVRTKEEIELEMEMIRKFISRVYAHRHTSTPVPNETFLLSRFFVFFFCFCRKLVVNRKTSILNALSISEFLMGICVLSTYNQIMITFIV